MADQILHLMGYELIITEKPQAAGKIASFLADGKSEKKNINKIPYYEITKGGKDIIVASAVGHLFTVSEEEKSWTYPKFDIKWMQSSKVNKDSAYTGKYVTALKKLAKDAEEITVATDYDIEGEVIGYNIVHHICKRKDAYRMKYSTLTKEEIIKSYENKRKSLDWSQVYAGLTRHELDWYYGINLSRALTSAVKSTGSFKLLSSGRVQGPALKILCEREKEIQKFVPEPYWEIELNGTLKEENITAMHKEDKFWQKEKADEVINKTKGKDGEVAKVNTNQFNQAPPVPFDLTTLQTEAYRSIKIPPKTTLELAQELYIAGLISYPRTSSQQLPKSIGYKKILNSLKENGNYKELAKKLLSKENLTPNNGKKTDPAHPAIYPTGQQEELDGWKARLYDLIARRFLATFAEPAKRETVTITIDVAGEPFIAKGTRTVEKGWHEFYGPFVTYEEQTMPKAKEKDFIKVLDIIQHSKETQPPKRYTPASIVRELEKRNLGTKSTRASIIENLFARGYVTDKSMSVTDLGMKTCNTLIKYSPRILDEELTREFEEEMENIYEKKKPREEVLKKAENFLIETLGDFKQKEEMIGNELKQAHFESLNAQATIGNCPNCDDGTIMIKKSKYGKFLACNKYPDCKTTFNIPNNGIVKGLNKQCEKCGYPMISIKHNRSSNKFCLNENCETRKTESDQIKADENGKKYEEEGMVCPQCSEGKMVLRKSFYGEFLGCNNYPKCKTMMAITDGKVNTTPITKNTKAKKKAKKTKTTTKKKTAKKTTKKKALKKTKKSSSTSAKKSKKKQN
ncbi:MAG: DNA topoisomerase I [Candidatus Nanoarchaeia archaeon]